ncbi:thioredoxin-like fold domain-containing protein MRL7, chloroplastic isoform X2 [Amaranthus tricolor]|uniref:thioredoxin-like fold domain-containing protein MRL7, chloroplastic isoform X2 n=1 Tax=Amaranthus tricolor TaxID=29722 RepID=UPI0025875A85|nr:thioredoxin-like fold domain-containing protein MRL7, chloroplastic isoform X2 [Amaranthus tricolor]
MSICTTNLFPRDCLSFGSSKTTIQIHPRYASLSVSLSMFRHGTQRLHHCAASIRKSDSTSNSKPDSNSDSKSKPKRKGRPKETRNLEAEINNTSEVPPLTIPRKPRRGHRREAVAVEDFVRGSLEKTFASIRQQNPDYFVNKEQILREGNAKTRPSDGSEDDNDIDDGIIDEHMVIEEEDPTWPVDADVGWGTRASDYFEKHPIKNIVGDDGNEIDWEGEIDDSWVQEINCLEWESYAFHPSPLIVLVFERYNRGSDNWKLLKELEKALKVYWNAKDRLPPRVCS